MEERRAVYLGCTVVLLGVLAVASCGVAAGADLRLGGSMEAWGTACPVPGGNASLDLFLGLGDLEAVTRTEVSVFPYTTGTETIALYLVRDWLSAGAEFRVSVLPIGVTAATILFSALPLPWDYSIGDTVLEFSVDGEARLVGDSFASAPLRAELWAKGAVTAARSLGWLDQVLLGVSLEATLSAPDGGRIWPVPAAIAELSCGGVSLRSETTIGPSMSLDAEKLTLRASWGEIGLSAEGVVAFARETEDVSIELRLQYEFGDTPLRRVSADSECSGGVCR